MHKYTSKYQILNIQKISKNLKLSCDIGSIKNITNNQTIACKILTKFKKKCICADMYVPVCMIYMTYRLKPSY